jgi:hypothetical protein
VDRSHSKSNWSRTSDERFRIQLAKSAFHSGGIHSKGIMSNNDSQQIVNKVGNFATFCGPSEIVVVKN